MPTLIALHEQDGALRAVAGYRGAADEALFLETYTREPIERFIGDRLGVRVTRGEIVEVGSLACRGSQAARELVTALVPALIGAGFTWVVFTGADTLRSVFRRLNLVPHRLCVADKRLLGRDQHDWGSYYDYHPTVMAGRLVEGIDALESMPGVQ